MALGGSIEKKRVLISGAGGFVGSHLCHTLVDLGGDVHSLVRSPPTAKMTSMKYLIGDLTDKLFLEEIIASIQPQLVVHLASNKNRSYDLAGWFDAWQQDILPAGQLINACAKVKCLEYFVSLGSCDEYGNQAEPFKETLAEAPLNNYGLAKLSITKLLTAAHNNLGFPATTLRPSVIFGPGQTHEMFIPSAISTMQSGRQFLMSRGTQFRDFVFIEDVVDAIIKALHIQPVNVPIINIASGKSEQIKDVAIRICELVGGNKEELISLAALNDTHTGIDNYFVNVELASKVLDWQPKTDFLEGLSKTVANFARLR